MKEALTLRDWQQIRATPGLGWQLSPEYIRWTAEFCALTEYQAAEAVRRSLAREWTAHHAAADG
jgi:hypothetical protein